MLSAQAAKRKRHPGADDDGDFGGNTGESCRVEDMPNVTESGWVAAWLGRGRENTGKFAAENIKEAVMQNESAWIVTLALVMTVAFAQIMMLPPHIAMELPDGFYGELYVRKVAVLLYVASFLIAAYNVMRLTMELTVKLLCVVHTPAYQVADVVSWRVPEDVKLLPEKQRLSYWFEKLMTTVFRIEYDGESIVEPNLLLMGFGYSIGLYLTQSWEVGLVAFGVVVGVYPSLRAAVQETFAMRRRVVESLPPSDLEAQYRHNNPLPTKWPTFPRRRVKDRRPPRRYRRLRTSMLHWQRLDERDCW